MKKLTTSQIWDYFILIARCLLAGVLFIYGFSKLTGHQFGVSKEVMNMPLKDISLFKVSWYLANHEPFKSFIGVSQILAGILILYNRTVILGALMSIPIWLNILIWDLSFMGLYTGFTIILPSYLLLTILILLHYKTKVFSAVQLCTQNITTKFIYPIWAYFLLPIFAFCLLMIITLPAASLQWLKHLLNL